MLRRIRDAKAVLPNGDAVAREYRRHGSTDRRTLIDLFSSRLADYGATVYRTAAPALPDELANALGGAACAVPSGLARAWTPPGAMVDYPPLDVATLDRVAVVVTESAAACAETGTIALDGSIGQGRRALTLVPDWHICVVHTEDIVHTVPELLARLVPTRPLTLISGPSATSDIELRRVQGVHGPRTLTVVLVGPELGIKDH